MTDEDSREIAVIDRRLFNGHTRRFIAFANDMREGKASRGKRRATRAELLSFIESAVNSRMLEYSDDHDEAFQELNEPAS